MFDSLSERLVKATRNLSGRGRLSEENIKDSLRQVRMALLEADVALPVVRDFVSAVKERAIGEEVGRSLSPGQALVKIIHAELVSVMGPEDVALNLQCQPPAVVLLAGLQGAGKTTTAAKLALRLQERDGRKVMLASTDVHRPAAVLQLEKLAHETGSGFFPVVAGQGSREIALQALAEARVGQYDVLLLDTAGRLHVDQDMMQELREIHQAVTPTETLFVVDAMAGQDAINSARVFSETVPLTGVVLSKTDGDARGGAALSVRKVTGAPIKFLGTGEKTDALEVFHPDRIASRILGMGDVLSLVEAAEQKLDRKKSEKLAKKLRKGREFDLSDLRSQLEQMLDMGGLGALLEKLPGGMGLPQGLAGKADEGMIRRQIAIINSMTPSERRFPKTVNGSRRRRIAAGSGTEVQEINRLLKQQMQMQKMMKRLGKGGMGRLLQGKGGPSGPFGGH
ncbi:MAG: signal recognition particle protein [Gammaproteobacteria bacterium]|nr:signal recognition particle protein [Gammaproteobacteria bacterium]MCZ6826480.1 signal recognition particle protein [Gammaproteobacteria bacterium]